MDVLVGLRRIDLADIVGDDAQAIYGFRGATARFLLDAETIQYLTRSPWTSTTARRA